VADGLDVNTGDKLGINDVSFDIQATEG